VSAMSVEEGNNPLQLYDGRPLRRALWSQLFLTLLASVALAAPSSWEEEESAPRLEVWVISAPLHGASRPPAGRLETLGRSLSKTFPQAKRFTLRRYRELTLSQEESRRLQLSTEKAAFFRLRGGSREGRYRMQLSLRPGRVDMNVRARRGQIFYQAMRQRRQLLILGMRFR
jgi:hypothetical protein